MDLPAVNLKAPGAGRRRGAMPFEDIGASSPFQHRAAAVGHCQGHRPDAGTEHTQAPTGAHGMQAQHREGVVLARFKQRGTTVVFHKGLGRVIFCYRADCSRKGDKTMQTNKETSGITNRKSTCHTGGAVR
jgi:hypothetical protein